MNDAVAAVEQGLARGQDHTFSVGDHVAVSVLIREPAPKGSKKDAGKEERERIQKFIGDVIAVGGRGLGRSFTVRRVVQGEGVERVFPLHSPLVKEVEVLRRGEVRRAKLYDLRKKSGKAARIKERTVRKDDEQAAAASPKPKRARKAETVVEG